MGLIMANGIVVFLNGTSSSGKTTIVKVLQDILTEPYLHFCVDTFIHMLPDRCLDGEQGELSMLIPKVVSAMHRCIAPSAAAGNNVIVDHVLENEEWLRECLDVLTDSRVLFVGVLCPLAELERRESKRDRMQGLAKWQFDRVHAHGTYDLQVDTSVSDPIECALQIKEALRDIHCAGAFDRLRARFEGGRSERPTLT